MQQYSQPQAAQFGQFPHTPNASGFNLSAATFVPQTPLTAQQPVASAVNPGFSMAGPMQSMGASNHYMYNPNNLANEANILKEKLQRRLAKDIEDFQAQLGNFPNFNAMPLKDKLEEWHFNVWPTSGVYKDSCINGVIQFPTEYPQKPPTIELSVPIPHPNVKHISSKAWVHLDILSSNKWKQSYSILDIFRELTSAFESTTINDMDNTDENDITGALERLRSFKCMWTGHRSDNPVPKRGQPIPHSRKQIDQLRAAQPLTIENHDYQWRYCRIKQIECSFGKVYFEARVIQSILGPNNLTTIQIGWALPPDDDPALGEEFEYVVLGNRYYMERIAGVIIHKRPFEISHNNALERGFGQPNDKVACAADFETKEITFWINGMMVGVIKFPNSFVDSDKPLVPVIGLSLASVELNFKNLQLPIAQLASSYLTIQEYLQIDRSDWVWERGSLVDWNVLFTYGLPMDVVPDAVGHSKAHSKDADRFRQIVLEIFHCLAFEDLSKCREVCKIWNEVINTAYFVHRSKLKCYYSDKSFDAKGAAIGLMLNLKIDKVGGGGAASKKALGHGLAAKISILSYSKDCISFNVWDKLSIHIDSKHEEFTHFLPLIINEEHGRRVTKTLTTQIAKIIERNGFRAEYALFLLSSLLNSVITTLHRDLFLRKSSSTKKRKGATAIISDALRLWCHLHHILLQLCETFPAMQTAADNRIRELFDNNYQGGSNKAKLSAIPELGTLIMYLLISDNYTWHTIRRLWVEESFSRDCKKLCQGDKNLAIKDRLDDADLPEKERLDIMLVFTKESRQLTRLLIAFLTLQHDPAAAAQSNRKVQRVPIEDQLRFYNLRYGSPNPLWVQEIEDKADEIMHSRSWADYFEGIFVVAPPLPILSNLLFRCFLQGGQQGYYSTKTKLPKKSKDTGRGQQATGGAPGGGPGGGGEGGGHRNQRDHRGPQQPSPHSDRNGAGGPDRGSPRGNNREQHMMNGGRSNGSNRSRSQMNAGNLGRGGRAGQMNGGPPRDLRDQMGYNDRGRGRGGRGRDDYGPRRGGGRGRGRDDFDRGFNDRRRMQPPPPNTSGRFANLRGDGPMRGFDRDRGRGYGRDFGGDRGGRGGGRRDFGSERGGRGSGRRDFGSERGGRGSDYGRGRRGRGGDNYSDGFAPNRNYSKHAATSYQASAISKFEKLPNWIRSGCARATGNSGDPVITQLNALQEKAIGDLCLGNDSVLVSPAGSGKTVALILAAFYRLFTRKAPAHVVFICVDHLRAETVSRLCQKMGADVPDLIVNKQVRGSRFVTDRQLLQGRNVFICSPGKAIALCEDWQAGKARDKLISNLVSVNIVDGDSLLVDPLMARIGQTFKYIPTDINVNIASNSLCCDMEKNMALLVAMEKTKRHLLHHELSHLKFWFIFSDSNLRATMLKELCKVNPYRQGLIYCVDARQARLVQEVLVSNNQADADQFQSRILNAEDELGPTNEIISQYNNGSIQYIVCHDLSPIHTLHRVDPKNLKVIINFALRNSSAFLKRCSVSKFQAPSKKIHYISLIDNDQTTTYEAVEKNCGVVLVDLPSNVQSVLVDGDEHEK